MESGPRSIAFHACHPQYLARIVLNRIIIFDVVLYIIIIFIKIFYRQESANKIENMEIMCKFVCVPFGSKYFPTVSMKLSFELVNTFARYFLKELCHVVMRCAFFIMITFTKTYLQEIKNKHKNSFFSVLCNFSL